MKNLITTLLKPSITYAATIVPNPSKKPLAVIIAGYIQVALGIIGGIALGMVIYGGILFITSSGDAEKVKKARDTLLWATVGIVLIASSYAIVVYFNKALGSVLK